MKMNAIIGSRREHTNRLSLPGQQLAESGSISTPQNDDRLLEMLLSGATVSMAAKCAGMSERTAYRRLACSEFQQQLKHCRETIRQGIISRLNDAAGCAVDSLWGLLEHEDPNIRLNASKAILDGFHKLGSEISR